MLVRGHRLFDELVRGRGHRAVQSRPLRIAVADFPQPGQGPLVVARNLERLGLFVEVALVGLLETRQVRLLILQVKEILVGPVELARYDQAVHLVEDQVLEQLDLDDRPPEQLVRRPRFVNPLDHQLAALKASAVRSGNASIRRR